MHAEPKQPRRVRVERGIYKSPATGRYEIQYTDSAGKIRWQVVNGGLREARVAKAEVETRIGRGDFVVRTDRTLEEVGEEWLAAQHHLRPRTRQLYRTALDLHIYPRLGRRRIGDVNPDGSPGSSWSSSRAGSPAGRSEASSHRSGASSATPLAAD